MLQKMMDRMRHTIEVDKGRTSHPHVENGAIRKTGEEISTRRGGKRNRTAAKTGRGQKIQGTGEENDSSETKFQVPAWMIINLRKEELQCSQIIL